MQTATEALEELNVLRKQLEEAQRKLVTAREEPPPGTEEFAQGSDGIAIDVYVDASITTTAWERYSPRFVVPIETTWDELFADIGPVLLDEANQSAIRRRRNRWFVAHAYDGAIAQTEEWIKDNSVTAGEYEADDGGISDHDFDTMLLQLRALGLITKSERNRSLKDTGTYWTLTPFGDTRLTALRAIRKGGALSDVRGPEEDAGE